MFEIKFDGNCDTGHDQLKYDMNIVCTTPHIDLSDDDMRVDADITHLNSLQRIERLNLSQ